MTGPALLPPNGVPRFYLGGPAIAALRGAPAPPSASGDRVPEDWVASTTEVFGEAGLGLSLLADGRLLRDVIAADPDGWLGAAHVRRWGADPALLVKLLDAGERLPVHVHPAGPFARTHLGTRFGKTEAWVVVGGAGAVHLGWREVMPPERLRELVATQDVDAMLAALHRVEVRVGDTVFVPAGVAHSIGAGLLIAELQEPSDMSVMLEWEGHGIAGEDEATLGLGWELGLACVERVARDPAPLVRAARTRPVPAGRALPALADPFFTATWVTAGPDAPARLDDAAFRVVVVLEGAGSLATDDGTRLELRRGDSLVIPYAAGTAVLRGELRALVCRPPDPTATGAS